mgnify:CR=1 FL=1
MSGPFGSTAWMSNPSTDFYGFPISNSLRFDAGSSNYLERDSYTHNRQIFTYSFWIKNTNPTVRQFIFGRYVDGNNVSALEYDSGGRLSWYDYQSSGYTFQQRTTALFRDVSAWYHVVLRVDTTDGTAGNRARMYVNGVELTSFGASTTVSQNVSFLLGDGGNDFRWGTEGSNNRLHFGGYLADITVIDGTSYAPSAFAETKNDIWIPKDTAGLTFGNGGYRLQFKQTGTSQNSSGIGADTGGNDEHFSVSALAAHDVVPDSPTNNFATLNPLLSDPSYPVTYSEGNLKSTQTEKYFSGASSIAITKAMGGKWYFEAKGISSGNFPMIGVMPTDKEQIPIITNNAGSSLRYTYGGYDGKIWHGSYASYGATWDQDVIGVAFDWDNKKIYFSKNGTFQNSGNPVNGNNPAFSSMTDGDYYFYLLNGAGASNRDQIWEVNFGQNGTFSGAHSSGGNADDNGIGDFLYDVPAGYLALCTANMTAPVATIDPAQGGSPQDYFNTVLYTGNASTSRAIDVGFSVDWAWVKQRSSTAYHQLSDSVRGANKQLFSNADVAENTTTSNMIKSFDSNGITIGDHNGVNANGATYVAWNWKAGTAFSNDASSTGVGSIDSAGSVNTDVGFSIIGYTGNNTDGATVAHGLGVVPSMIITKSRSADSLTGWMTKHKDLASNYNVILNGTDVAWNPSSNGWVGDLNNTATFSLENGSTNGNNANQNTITYIAYCFAEVDGYSKFGKYIGNGNADGTFVYTGFRPAWVMIKRADSASSWSIHDTARDTFNVTQKNLYANLTAAEESQATWQYDILSNGIKLIGTSGEINASGGTYIYLAFAEQSFKYANAR